MTFEEIKIQCIVHGALMTVTGADCTITEMVDAIKEEDENAKFQEQFFTRGGKGGNRDTKSAIAQSITVKKFSGNTSVEIVAVTSDGEAITARVGKKSIEQYPDALLSVAHDGVKKDIGKAFNADKGGTVLLMKEEHKFIVKYFDIDGSCYVDSLEAASNES